MSSPTIVVFGTLLVALANGKRPRARSGDDSEVRCLRACQRFGSGELDQCETLRYEI